MEIKTIACIASVLLLAAPAQGQGDNESSRATLKGLSSISVSVIGSFMPDVERAGSPRGDGHRVSPDEASTSVANRPPHSSQRTPGDCAEDDARLLQARRDEQGVIRRRVTRVERGERQGKEPAAEGDANRKLIAIAQERDRDDASIVRPRDA